MARAEDKYDNEEIRCRKLGHNVTFKYCRKESVDEPCEKMIDCWYSRMKIFEYLNGQFGTKFLQEFINRERKGKITSILEIVDRHRGEAKKEEKPE